MLSIIIASNCSSGGKTTFTLALIKALVNRGYKVQGYKVGPDYIDTAFHTYISKRASRNLDAFLMGEEGVKEAYTKGNGDIGIIEGVMGLYDGLGLNTQYSTYHISKILKLPIILLVTPKAQSNTLCAELLGILNYKDADIIGVVLNNINKEYYVILKRLIEKNTNLTVFGFIPKDDKIALESRHLGLIQSCETDKLDYKIERASKLLEENVDLTRLISYFKNTEVKSGISYNRPNKKLKIAYALDKAFNFYYKDNLELFQSIGELVPFSPLNDKKLPQDIDFLYIGGGYPEVFEKKLAGNRELLSDIKNKLEQGLPAYAECGGLMYLTKGSETSELVRFFEGIYKFTDKLINFGYATTEVNKSNHILKKGLKINCHEFHKSYVDLNEEKMFKLTKDNYGEVKEWECGYIKKNVVAAYAHVHFYGNIEFFDSLIKLAIEHKESLKWTDYKKDM